MQVWSTRVLTLPHVSPLLCRFKGWPHTEPCLKGVSGKPINTPLMYIKHKVCVSLCQGCPSLNSSLTSAHTSCFHNICHYACEDMHAHVLCEDSWISVSVCVHAWSPPQHNSTILCLRKSTKGIPCVQHFSSLLICLWPFRSPKMTMKDHDPFASKTWEGFGGQVKEDAARIWPGLEEERKTEKENRCLTF